MSNAITTKDLVKQFKTVRALDSLSLEIPSGITYGLLGPNGSGKTTLIRILVGIVSVTSGQVQVLSNTPGSADISNQIGYMTQLPALYQDLSVQENLEFFAKIYGLGKKKKSSRINGLLDLIDLKNKRKTTISALSGGMKQRTSLACALVHSPKLLFLDEPTVGVDPALRKTFWDYFKKLNNKGVTIVVSSHIMDEAQRSDKLALLRNGRLLTEGTLSEILQKTSKDNLEDAFLALEASPQNKGGSLNESH